jgi:hypothetical protein
MSGAVTGGGQRSPAGLSKLHRASLRVQKFSIHWLHWTTDISQDQAGVR